MEPAFFWPFGNRPLQPMLSLTNISVHFGQRTLFEHIDLFIGQRERVGLVGRNGAGKSTLLRAFECLQ